MHEFAITQSLLDMAVAKAREARAGRVTAINLVIGGLSDVVDECVRFYFDMLSGETLARGAQLNFRKVPLQIRCRGCGAAYNPVPGAPWTCPACGGSDAEIASGKEFFIESIEVE